MGLINVADAITEGVTAGAIRTKEYVDTNLASKAKQTDLDVEKARIDSFTALEIGSTTGDAELIDGRVDDLSITHANIGDAIRARSGQLKKNIDKLFHLTTTTGYYDTNGIKHVSNGWAMIDQYIPISAISSVTATLWDTIGGVCYYDKYKKFIGSESNSVSGSVVITSLTPPQNAYYCRFCYFVNNPTTFTINNWIEHLLNECDNFRVTFDNNTKGYSNIKTLKTDGSGDNSDWKTACIGCSALKNCLLIIYPGEYNVVAENNIGIVVNFDIKAYDGAKVVCNYDGSNSTITSTFSPLILAQASNTNIIIDGLAIEVTNCRYCIHDEMGTYSNYIHTFKHCNLRHNSPINETWDLPRCIGGGLGANGRINIESCVFYSVIDTSIDYHSAYNGQSYAKDESRVFIKDCIAENNTFSATCHRSSSSYLNKTYVNNCLVNATPYLIKTLEDGANNEMVQWNNTIIN